MIPAMLAAKPLIKYGLLIGVPVLLLTMSHTWMYWSGKHQGQKEVRVEWDAALARQAKESARQVVAAQAMASAVVNEAAQEQRMIAAQAKHIKREVVHNARQDPKPLSAAVVSLYDRLISVPNETSDRLPPSDLRPGTPEVPRGGLAAPTIAALQDEDGNPIELTTEELAQAAVDFAEKYALMKSAYKGLSDWNDGRERIETQRVEDQF